MPQAAAAFSMMALAWRLEEIKRTTPPDRAVSLTKSRALASALAVFSKSMISISCLVVWINSFILGYLLDERWPKCTQAFKSSINSGIGGIFFFLLFTPHHFCYSI